MKKITILLAFALLSVAALSAQRAGRLSEERFNNQRRNHTLTIYVTPAKNYQIFVNDIALRGSQARLSEGIHRVRVESNGFESWSRTVNLNSDQRLQANLVYQVYTLSFAISNSDNYQVHVNGKRLNARSISLSGGTHSIQITADGFEPYQNNVTLNSDQLIRVSLVASTGTLQVNIPPNAKLSINGQRYEQDNIRLASGNYRIRVDFGRLHTQTRVNIRSGQTTNLQLGLNIAVSN